MPKPEQPVAKSAMPDEKRIAGVVLAGGQSSRMGQNKVFLDFQGRPLLDHMIALLRQITGDVYVSGDYEGYDCIPDSKPFAGPAAAIRDVLNRLNDYDNVLFVPVDMPFLTPELLLPLLQHETGARYEGWPLPLCLAKGQEAGQGESVKSMISAMCVTTLSLPQGGQDCFVNINTPEEWKEVIGK